MRRTAQRVVVLASATVLALTGCGRDSDDGGDGDGAAPGVTSEPCPEAVDEEKGCIYLGVISDLSSAFKSIGIPLTEGQRAFWKKVNEDGGIGDYEVDVTKYARDNGYDPTKAVQAFSEIEGDILALGQSLGTAHTEGILQDPAAADMVISPASLGSNWIFEDRVIEVGSSYCGDAMNAVDYAVDELGAKSVAAVHFPGDYGDDAAVGTRIAAEERGITFTDIPTAPGADKQTAAIAALIRKKPDVVVISTGPVELAAVAGGAAQQGFTGKFIGSIPSWNPALLQTPAAPALEALYLQSTSFGTWDADTPGHTAMRAAAGSTAPNDYYALGWTGAYLMKAALEKAIEDDSLTREGLLDAVKSLDGVDGDGMLPEGSGNYAGEPNDALVRATAFNKVDKASSTGVSQAVEPFVGPTLEAYEFEEACYLQK